jgi:Recombination endonuclease VII
MKMNPTQRLCANPKCRKEFTPGTNNPNRQKFCSRGCSYHPSPHRSKRNREWKQNNRPKTRAASRKYYTGFTAEEFERKVKEQGGLCPVFGIPLLTQDMPGYDHHAYNAAVADHCHVTGWRRGVLTAAANRVLGIFHDDPVLLRQAGLIKAAEYLEQYTF